MNERNKKVYTIFIAVLLVLSIVTSFLPSVQVKADSETLGDFVDINKFGIVFTQSGYTSVISGSNNSSLVNCTYDKFSDLDYNSLLSDDENYDSTYASSNGYYKLEDLPINVNGNVIGVFLGTNVNNNTFTLYVLTSDSDITKLYFTNGFSLSAGNGHSEPSGFWADNEFSVNSISFKMSFYNDFRYFKTEGNWIQSTSTNNVDLITQNGWENFDLTDNFNVSSNSSYIVCSTIPIYLGFNENDSNLDSSNISGFRSITSFVHYMIDDSVSIRWGGDGTNTSGYEDFLIDRRSVFPDYANYNPSLDVNTDPLSQEYKGAWDIDLVPVDDLLDGSIKVKFVPTQKLSTDNPNYSVKYYFGFFFNGKKFNYNSLVDRPLMNVGMSQVIYGNANAGNFKSIELNNYYNITDTDGISVNTVSDDYISLPTSTVLRGLTPVGSYTLQGALVGGNLGQNSNPINVYQSLAFYKSQNMFNQNNGGNNIGGSFGSISVGLSSNQGGLTSAKLIVQAQAFYNGSEASNVATVTYNYLTGEITKQGTVSTDNNTPVDSTTGIPDGITPQEQQAIDSSTQNIVTNGGSISGGNNTNQNTNNPTFTNNNNPSITINNNNGLTEPDGVPENPEEGSFSMLWSIWESYHFAEWLNQDLEGNGFLHYIFSSEIWNLPIFNLIIPALAILITVSIASTIIRFIRGN